MSSSPSRPDARLVPMTHADVSWLHTSADTPERREALMRLNIAFNSAPADPVVAVRGAIFQWWMSDEAEDDDPMRAVDPVLAALGFAGEATP